VGRPAGRFAVLPWGIGLVIQGEVQGYPQYVTSTMVFDASQANKVVSFREEEIFGDYRTLISHLLLNHFTILKDDQGCFGLFGNLTCPLGCSFHRSINLSHVYSIAIFSFWLQLRPPLSIEPYQFPLSMLIVPDYYQQINAFNWNPMFFKVSFRMSIVLCKSRDQRLSAFK